MAFRVFDRDFTDAVTALAGSCELDAIGDEPLVDAVDVVDDETDPGSETSCLLLPVRNRSIQPDLTVAHDELHVADNPVVVGSSFALNIDARRQQLIGLVESVPDVAAEVAGDADQHVGFTVRKKRFAWYLDDHHGDEIVALTCRPSPGDNTELVAQEPGRFFIPIFTGKRGWLGVRLDLPTVDWEEIADLVEDAYRMTAPKSLLARLDPNTGRSAATSRPAVRSTRVRPSCSGKR